MPVAELVSRKREKPSHKREQARRVTLRGLVYPDSGSYIAECVDLNIMVRRDSAEEAFRGMQDAVSGYLETVFENEEDARMFAETGKAEGLIPRPSPLSHRLRYDAFCLVAAFVGAGRNFQIVDCSVLALSWRVPCKKIWKTQTLASKS